MVGKRTRNGRRGKPARTVWYFSFSHKKHRFYKSGFCSKTDAEEAQYSKMRDVKGRLNTPIPTRFISFSMWLPRFIEYRTTMGKSPRTVANEARRGKVLSKIFGSTIINDIESRDIANYIAQRKAEGVSHRTINLELTFLRTFFRHAMQNHLSQHNPAREVTNLPEQDGEEVWIPTKQEFLCFINAAKTLPTAQVFVPWIWFRALTGTRPAESFFLEWDDIEFDNNRIWIRPKPGNPLKNRSKRFIPMHPDLKPVLLAWKKEWERIQARWSKRNGHQTPHQWVFFHPHDYDEKTNGFLRSFRHANKISGLPRMTPYTLRHYFISQCIMSGIDHFTISKWVGQKGTRMIDTVYGHITPDYSAMEMAKLRVVPDTPTKQSLVASISAEKSMV